VITLPPKFDGGDIAKAQNADMPNPQKSNLALESGSSETSRDPPARISQKHCRNSVSKKIDEFLIAAQVAKHRITRAYILNIYLPWTKARRYGPANREMLTRSL
jgi:hypothetical protein